MTRINLYPHGLKSQQRIGNGKRTTLSNREHTKNSGAINPEVSNSVYNTHKGRLIESHYKRDPRTTYPGHSIRSLGQTEVPFESLPRDYELSSLRAHPEIRTFLHIETDYFVIQINVCHNRLRGRVDLKKECLGCKTHPSRNAQANRATKLSRDSISANQQRSLSVLEAHEFGNPIAKTERALRNCYLNLTLGILLEGEGARQGLPRDREGSIRSLHADKGTGGKVKSLRNPGQLHICIHILFRGINTQTEVTRGPQTGKAHRYCPLRLQGRARLCDEHQSRPVLKLQKGKFITAKGDRQLRDRSNHRLVRCLLENEVPADFLTQDIHHHLVPNDADRGLAIEQNSFLIPSYSEVLTYRFPCRVHLQSKETTDRDVWIGHL